MTASSVSAPSSRHVPTSLNKGRPVVLEEPNEPVSQSVIRLAQRFTGVAADEPEGAESLEPAPQENKKRGWFRRR